MQIIRGLHNIKKKHFGSFLTIGNFDGVHLGHKNLINKIIKKKKKKKKPIIIMLFEPQPLEFLSPNIAPIRINKFCEKIKYLSKFKIDAILCIKFNKKFSTIKPKKFIKKILVKKLKINFLFVGNDFKFGYKKKGNIKHLKKANKKKLFNLYINKPFKKNNKRISSTLIRKNIKKNKFKLVKSMLGRNYSIHRNIIHELNIVKKTRFPKANILLYKNKSLLNGVYITKIKGIKKKNIFSIINIEKKSTFKGNIKHIKAHILNINIKTYKKKIEIIILKKIRNEIKFNSKKKLKKQIKKDIMIACSYFKINHLNKNNIKREKYE
ncbi:bifunctional riboflavin kinase/FAD synthetase [Buchnera aphidicola]|uniref:bifunctional riboflavin kinase/FAD synthetase n=1 Tax=Buchnera aphidicola TaxID=9 RepID=UPI0031B8636B